MSRAWIGLGSNLDAPRRQIEGAFAELEALPGTRLEGRSFLYSSSPMGPADQPDYVNAVALLETDLAPLVLLDALQAIEARHGRVRERRWGPRTLDLDLLLYDEKVMATPRLTLPHPGIGERDFVLLPLMEIAGDIEIPGRGRASRLLAQCPARTARRIE
jgi:2-amino-4-hydroxy-6-hydroxymethyldihydropteridine pyrophosphokinase